jgi:hypothetical protein
LDREVGRISAPEDPVDVRCRLRVYADYVEKVGDQGATPWENLVGAEQRQTVTCCGGDDHIAMRDDEAVRQTDQAASRFARLGGDGFFYPCVLVTGASVTVIPKDGAAASIALLNNVEAVVSGLKMTATRVTFGATSLSS